MMLYLPLGEKPEIGIGKVISQLFYVVASSKENAFAYTILL